MAFNFSITDKDIDFIQVKKSLDQVHHKCREMKIPSSISIKNEVDRIHNFKIVTYTYVFKRMP